MLRLPPVARTLESIRDVLACTGCLNPNYSDGAPYSSLLVRIWFKSQTTPTVAATRTLESRRPVPNIREARESPHQMTTGRLPIKPHVGALQRHLRFRSSSALVLSLSAGCDDTTSQDLASYRRQS